MADTISVKPLREFTLKEKIYYVTNDSVPREYVFEPIVSWIYIISFYFFFELFSLIWLYIIILIISTFWSYIYYQLVKNDTIFPTQPQTEIK